MKSKFFIEVSRLASEHGFEDKGVERGMLQLHLNGKLAAEVDESGAMMYSPYKEVFALMDEVEEARNRITDVQYVEGNELVESTPQVGQTLC